VQTDVDNWTDLVIVDPSGGPTVFSMTHSEIVTALGATSIADIAEITGMRFTFDKASGFGADTTVTPQVVASARSTLRDSGDGVTPEPGPDGATVYTNAAIASGHGSTPVTDDLEDDDTDTDDATIITNTGEGPGTLRVGKRWTDPIVDAQSDQ